MFTEDEAEGIAVGVRLLARTVRLLTNAPVYVSKSRAPVPAQRDLPSTIRHAIRAARKLRIAYQDGDGRSTQRVIQPFAIAYYVGGDVDLRLVRATQRCPPFPHRPGGQRRCARRVVLNP